MNLSKSFKKITLKLLLTEDIHSDAAQILSIGSVNIFLKIRNSTYMHDWNKMQKHNKQSYRSLSRRSFNGQINLLLLTLYLLLAINCINNAVYKFIHHTQAY